MRLRPWGFWLCSSLSPDAWPVSPDWTGCSRPTSLVLRSRTRSGSPRSVRELSGVDLEQVWDATLLVCLQEGILVRSSKPTGSLVVMGGRPMALCIEPGAPVRVHLNWMNDLYLPAQGPAPLPRSSLISRSARSSCSRRSGPSSL